MAITVTEEAGGFTRFSSDLTDVSAHNQSGEVNSYSPNGRWLGLLAEDNWHLWDRTAKTLTTIHPRAWNGSSNNVLQWTTDNKLLRINGLTLERYNPDTDTVEATLALDPHNELDSSWDFHNWRSGDSMNQTRLHITHAAGMNDGSDALNILHVIDPSTLGVVHQYNFDSNVHQGDATQDRWHHLFKDGAVFLTTLSGFGVDPGAHYSFNEDGTGWTQIANISGGGTTSSLLWSHVTYDASHVAYGNDNHVDVGDYTTGVRAARYDEPAGPGASFQGWGHGCLVGDEVVYSLFNATDNADLEVKHWVWGSGNDPTTIQTLSGLSRGDVASRARPQMTYAKDEAGWHILRTSGGRVEYQTKVLEGASVQSDRSLRCIRNAPYRMTFALRDDTGAVISGATQLDSELSIDGGLFTDTGAEATEIGTSGVYFLDLDASELQATSAIVIVKSVEALTHVFELPFEPCAESGVVAASSSSVTRLRAGAASDDDFFNGMVCEIVRGIGIGQTRTITDYDGTALDITLDRPWTVTPDTTSVYKIIDIAAQHGSDIVAKTNLAQVGALELPDWEFVFRGAFVQTSVDDPSPSATSWTGAAGLSATDDFYNNSTVIFVSGALAGLQRVITDYAGATRTFTVGALPQAPADGDEFVIFGRSF